MRATLGYFKIVELIGCFFSVRNRCLSPRSEQKVPFVSVLCRSDMTWRQLLLQGTTVCSSLELTRVKIIAQRLGNDPRAGKLWAWPAVLPCGRAHELQLCPSWLLSLKSSNIWLWVIFPLFPPPRVMRLWGSAVIFSGVFTERSSSKPGMSRGRENIKQSLFL